jgi:hypothetical protein
LLGGFMTGCVGATLVDFFECVVMLPCCWGIVISFSL